MRRFPFHYLLAMVALVPLCAANAAKATILASFEDQTSDGFGYFSNTNGVVPFASAPSSITYSYSSTGATDGTTALDVNSAGFTSGDLSYDFVASGKLALFMANDIISFTVAPPTSSTPSGFWQIFSLTFNAPGFGFNNVGTQPFANQFPPFSSTNPLVVSFNYDAVKSAISANPGFVQFIITTNQGSGAPQDFFFDNFTLTSATPEPASVGVLGFGAAGLLMRRRRAQ